MFGHNCINCFYKIANSAYKHQCLYFRLQAKDLVQFKEHLTNGAKCMYGQATSLCESSTAAYYWMFIISYCLANMMYFLLIRFADGAVYLVITLSASVPFGSLIFALIQTDPKFHWDNTVWCRIVGEIIIIIAVGVFYRFSERSERESRTHSLEPY